MLKLTVIKEGRTEQDRTLLPGMIVQYLGHLPGGVVGIVHEDGTKDVAHPACFKELQ